MIQMTQKSGGVGSSSYTRIVIGERNKMWAEWGLGLMDPWISRGWSIFPEVGRRFGSRVAELGIWPLHHFKAPFHSWPRGRGDWVWARGLTDSHLFIAGILGSWGPGRWDGPMPGLASQSQGSWPQGPAH